MWQAKQDSHPSTSLYFFAERERERERGNTISFPRPRFSVSFCSMSVAIRPRYPLPPPRDFLTYFLFLFLTLVRHIDYFRPFLLRLSYDGPPELRKPFSASPCFFSYGSSFLSSFFPSFLSFFHSNYDISLRFARFPRPESFVAIGHGPFKCVPAVLARAETVSDRPHEFLAPFPAARMRLTEGLRSYCVFCGRECGDQCLDLLLRQFFFKLCILLSIRG